VAWRRETDWFSIFVTKKPRTIRSNRLPPYRMTIGWRLEDYLRGYLQHSKECTKMNIVHT
jgi:hypothetical protein